MNAVVVCVHGVPAWANTEGPCVSGLTRMIWRLRPLNGNSYLVRLSLPYLFV